MDIPQQICDLITLVYDKETDKIFVIPTANDKPVKIVYERFDWETKVDSNNITFSKKMIFEELINEVSAANDVPYENVKQSLLKQFTVDLNKLEELSKERKD